MPPGPGKTGYDSDLTADGIRRDYWNWGEGFLSAYPPDQFIMLEQGATYGGNNNQIWAPYYTLHKIYAGLMDTYRHCQNPEALAVAERMASWNQSRLSKLDEQHMQEMLEKTEQGGMNEAFANLYALTGALENQSFAQIQHATDLNPPYQEDLFKPNPDSVDFDDPLPDF